MSIKAKTLEIKNVLQDTRALRATDKQLAPQELLEARLLKRFMSTGGGPNRYRYRHAEGAIIRLLLSGAAARLDDLAKIKARELEVIRAVRNKDVRRDNIEIWDAFTEKISQLPELASMRFRQSFSGKFEFRVSTHYKVTFSSIGILHSPSIIHPLYFSYRRGKLLSLDCEVDFLTELMKLTYEEYEGYDSETPGAPFVDPIAVRFPESAERDTKPRTAELLKRSELSSPDKVHCVSRRRLLASALENLFDKGKIKAHRMDVIEPPVFPDHPR